jgi:hypothetical protein
MSNQIDAQIDAQTDAQKVHDRLQQALAKMREAECNAVTIFAEIFHRRLYRELGYASIHIYAGEALGFSRSKTYEFIRLAESLKQLPQLKRGLESGAIHWTKASAIARVATPETENRWLEMAKSSSRRELEGQVLRSRAIRNNRKRDSGQGDLLSRHASGQESLPGKKTVERQAPPEAAPVQSMTLRLAPLQRARFEAMVEKLMKRHRCGKGEVLLMALEAFLGSGERSEQDTESRQSEKSSRLDKSSLREAQCPGKESHRLDSVTPYQIIVHQCEICGTGSVGPDPKPLSKAEMAQVECDARVLKPGKRNRSSIPPSRRRAVLERDGRRCSVRGCSSTSFLEVHHIKNRSNGGSNSEDNLVVLCSNCHGHVHERGGVLPPLRKP